MGGRGTKAKGKNALGDADELASANENRGTPWTSPRGSILSNTNKVNMTTLRKMYQAERGKGSYPTNVDATTQRAFNLGYKRPKIRRPKGVPASYVLVGGTWMRP